MPSRMSYKMILQLAGWIKGEAKYVAPLGIACFSWITKRYDGSMTMKNKDYVEPNEKMFCKRCP